MSEKTEDYIRNNVPWSKLPLGVKQRVDNSEEYEKKVVEYSIKNQLRYRGNLVRQIVKSEKQYYEELLKYSKEHLMLFPYHLSDFIVSAMRMTPFQFYVAMIQDLLEQEKSYDTLPNFSAADCLRLLAIGRNQYIDLMNQFRSHKKFLGMIRKPAKDLLPTRPVKAVPIEPWWELCAGYITEEDVKFMVTSSERQIIDKIVAESSSSPIAGEFNQEDVKSLYLKGLMYLDVPIKDQDLIVVPPLKGFVMNRVTGDYLETLLYKIFVSIDENTPVVELANVLQIDLPLVKNAISVYCRLGFAFKKNLDSSPNQYHPSWKEYTRNSRANARKTPNSQDLVNFIDALADDSVYQENGKDFDTASVESADISADEGGKVAPSVFTTSVSNPDFKKRIALLFDSTLAAFLMMGNLSPGLKTHAVTLYEAGKLSHECMDSLLAELSKISIINEEKEGCEAGRYFVHAAMLYKTIRFLRNNPELVVKGNTNETGMGVDLIRCESLRNLDAETYQRLLEKNYQILISVAPLGNETRLIKSENLPHLGPCSPVINSIWFKLFLYHLTGFGPPSLLLTKGQRLYNFPDMLDNYDVLLITPWGRDFAVIPVGNALFSINDGLTHSTLLVQGYPSREELSEDEIVYIPLPLCKEGTLSHDVEPENPFESHPAVIELSKHFDLTCIAGYITLIKDTSMKSYGPNATLADSVFSTWTLFDLHFGIPLFDRALNKSVCSKIVSHGLCEAENLAKVMDFNNQLCLKLTSFVENFRSDSSSSKGATADEKQSKYLYTFPLEKDLPVPLPSCSLTFSGTTLERWT